MPLELAVHEYRNGVPAEGIAHCYPTLSLEKIRGALAFYHGNKADVERAIEASQGECDQFAVSHPMPDALKARLENAKSQLSQRG